MILEVLKYILVVLGIIAVGAFVIWGLVSLILIIVEPKKEEPKETYRHYDDRPVTYEPHAYITKEPEYIAEPKAKEFANTEYVPENAEVKALDYAKAMEEERALNAGAYDQLTAEEEEFIREKQRNIEERMSNKVVKETVEEETVDLDSIFIDDEEPVKEEVQVSEDRPVDTTEFDDEKEDDIEALIAKILDGDEDVEDDSFLMEDEEPQTVAPVEETAQTTETVEEVAEEETFEEAAQEVVEEQTEEISESVKEAAEEVAPEIAEEQEVMVAEEATETVEEPVAEEVQTEEEIEGQVSMLADGQDAELVTIVEEVIANADEDKIQELTEELARQKEEYEARIAELEQAKSEEIVTNGEDNNERIAELESALEQEKANKDKIAELENMLAEKEAEKAALMEENKRMASERKSGPALPLEEYEQRLEILKERLKANERDFKLIKKEYLPLAKIKKTLEKDNKKLRRKEALVAKQKVVLYGVNNYVDIDEEKAKKLAEDLDLLEGLRLSVQHCEEVMKANAERYPILENSYNILVETNANLKADIEECNQKIAEIKANMADGEEE